LCQNNLSQKSITAGQCIAYNVDGLAKYGHQGSTAGLAVFFELRPAGISINRIPTDDPLFFSPYFANPIVERWFFFAVFLKKRLETGTPAPFTSHSPVLAPDFFLPQLGQRYTAQKKTCAQRPRICCRGGIVIKKPGEY
jgi:hypothetical protein